MPPFANRRTGSWIAINEGIADGTFKKDSNPYLVRSMLLGTIEHLFIHWHMQGMPQRETSILEMLDPLIEMVLDGIRAAKAEQGLTLYLKHEDARALGELLRSKEALKTDTQAAAGQSPRP